MSLHKPSSLTNVSIDSNHNYLHYPDFLDHSESNALSVKKKVVSQLNTQKTNVTNQERDLEISSLNNLTSMPDNILLTMREKTMTMTKTLTKLLTP